MFNIYEIFLLHTATSYLRPQNDMKYWLLKFKYLEISLCYNHPVFTKLDDKSRM